MGPNYVSNLIVGAGPAGLAVAGRLRKMNIPFEVVERSDKIAFSWHNHYDRLCLHTVKQMSNLPFVDFSDDMPVYIPRQQLVEYYENYARHFRIRPFFNEEVIRIARHDRDNWRAEMGKWKEIYCRKIL